MFNHKKHKKFPTVKRKNINGVRHYVDEEYNIYHSVTRVVNHGKDFSGWHESLMKQYKCNLQEAQAIAEYVKRNAGMLGTKLHNMCETYLNNKTPYREGLIPTAHFDNLKPYLDKINNIKGLEDKMFSKSLGLAGTVDCVAEYEGIPSIIDFKTSKKMREDDYIQSYYLQATAYSIMWEENTGEKINELRILMTAEDGQHECFRQNRINFEDKLKEKIEEFKNSITV